MKVFEAKTLPAGASDPGMEFCFAFATEYFDIVTTSEVSNATTVDSNKTCRIGCRHFEEIIIMLFSCGLTW
jgi:hypothetical protein